MAAPPERRLGLHVISPRLTYPTQVLSLVDDAFYVLLKSFQRGMPLLELCPIRLASLPLPDLSYQIGLSASA